uniref:Uncharacterized protein n=1 Tax=Sphaerodactylus townsendi TaxID=933632 RepID=A0ACB8F1Y3_9SAUR
MVDPSPTVQRTGSQVLGAQQLQQLPRQEILLHRKQRPGVCFRPQKGSGKLRGTITVGPYDSWNKTWNNYVLPWLRRAETKLFLTKQPHQQEGLLQYCRCRQLLQYWYHLRQSHQGQHLHLQLSQDLCPHLEAPPVRAFILLVQPAPLRIPPLMPPLHPPGWWLHGGVPMNIVSYGAPPPFLPQVRLAIRYDGTQELLPAFLVQLNSHMLQYGLTATEPMSVCNLPAEGQELKTLVAVQLWSGVPPLLTRVMTWRHVDYKPSESLRLAHKIGILKPFTWLYPRDSSKRFPGPRQFEGGLRWLSFNSTSYRALIQGAASHLLDALAPWTHPDELAMHLTARLELALLTAVVKKP